MRTSYNHGRASVLESPDPLRGGLEQGSRIAIPRELAPLQKREHVRSTGFSLRFGLRAHSLKAVLQPGGWRKAPGNFKGVCGLKPIHGLFVAVFLVAMLGGILWAEPILPPTPAELQKIAKATENVTAAPAQAPRRVLVCSLVPTGYVHSAIPFGKAALDALAKKTGAFTPSFTDDIAAFEWDSLSSFDAVFFNNANNELFMPPNFKDLSPEEQTKAREHDQRLKENLVRFVQSGKGLAVLHASLAIFREWDEYGNIIGGRFDNHPWHQEVTIRVEEPGHPLLKAFKDPEFRLTDEIYQVKGPYSRATHRVLLSLDLEKSGAPNLDKLHREDKDYALAWIKPYGHGRVFYCGLGHDHDLFWNPAILQFLMDGTQYAIGDLAADATPSATRK